MEQPSQEQFPQPGDSLDLVQLHEALRCFVKLPEATSLRAIGVEVFGDNSGDPQSRVSRRLDYLHDVLGLDHDYLRSRKEGQHGKHTGAGEMFVSHALQIIGEIEQQEQNVRRMLEQARRQMERHSFYSLAITPTLDVKWLPGFQARIRKSEATGYLDLNERAAKMLSAEIETAVTKDQTHEIGILQLPEPGSRRDELRERFRATVLFKDPFVAAMHQQHPLAGRKSLKLADFRDAPGYVQYVNGRATERVNKALARHKVNPVPVQGFHVSASVDVLLKADPGSPRITIVPRLFLDPALILKPQDVLPRRPFPQIVTRPITDFGPPREVGFICREGPLSRQGELVLAALELEAERYRASLKPGAG